MPTPPTPAQIRSMLYADNVPEAVDALREVIGAGLPADQDPADWARVAESCGQSLLALSCWQEAHRRTPEASEALERLAELHTVRGDHARAKACRQRLVDLGVALSEPAEPSHDEPVEDDAQTEPEVGPGDLVRFIHLFSGRAGVHARQWRRGQGRGTEIGWGPVDASLSPGLVEAHLAGDVTLGSYLVRRDDCCTQLVLDIDLTKPALEAAWGAPDRARILQGELDQAGQALHQWLTEQGLAPLLVDSGFKGRHLWCFLSQQTPAADVRRVGQALVDAGPRLGPDLNVEVFPKQDRVAPGGLGNLVKLPLGVHLRTDRRCRLLSPDGQRIDDPWPILRAVRTTALPPAPTVASPARIGARPVADPAELPAPPPPDAPPFTEADLDARPRLAAVRAGCAVLRTVVDDALSDRRITAEAAVVLEHSLGHLAEGVEAVNYIGRTCEGAALSMGKPHRGSPISCTRVRQRLSEVAARVGCACSFDGDHRYAHPLLHIEGGTTEPQPKDVPLEQRLDALGRLQRRLERLGQERDALRRHVADALGALPGGSFMTAEGTWEVQDVDGIPAVTFSPAAEPS